MMTIRVRRESLAARPDGKFDLTIVVHSDVVGRWMFQMRILDQGSQELNLEEARGLLQRFSRELADALLRPLAFE
jgi:hypothetical protein